MGLQWAGWAAGLAPARLDTHLGTKGTVAPQGVAAAHPSARAWPPRGMGGAPQKSGLGHCWAVPQVGNVLVGAKLSALKSPSGDPAAHFTWETEEKLRGSSEKLHCVARLWKPTHSYLSIIKIGQSYFSPKYLYKEYTSAQLEKIPP